MSVLLTKEGTFKHKVSTTLNGSSDYASKHMFDSSLHTCWNSDQGDSQFIVFDFCRPVNVHKLSIMFQGGFVGQDCKVETGVTTSSFLEVAHLQGMRDDNDLQHFDLPPCDSPSRYLRLTFQHVSDFYGRIIIYNLEIYGEEMN